MLERIPLLLHNLFFKRENLNIITVAFKVATLRSQFFNFSGGRIFRLNSNCLRLRYSRNATFLYNVCLITLIRQVLQVPV